MKKQPLLVTFCMMCTFHLFSQWTGTSLEENTYRNGKVGIKTDVIIDNFQIGKNNNHGEHISMRLNSGLGKTATLKFRESTGDYGFDFLYNGENDKLFINSMIDGNQINNVTINRSNGYVGIKTDVVIDNFQIGKNNNHGEDISMRLNSGLGKTATLKFRESTGDYGFNFLYSGAEDRLDINSIVNGVETNNMSILRGTGQVGIGTQTIAREYLFAVAGKIGAKEIEVSVSDWADYVFENDYKLRTIKEVETFIKENKHLPEIPSEKDIKREGLNLGEMDALLLKKIEELTLYVIQLNKENIALKKYVKEHLK